MTHEMFTDSNDQQPPVVLVLAGHDPTGGAGIMADSEAITACGGWAMTVPTALTVQDCTNVHRVVPVPTELIREMAARLVEFRPAAIKVGLLTSLQGLDAVIDILREHPSIPVVVDPVLKAGGGKELSTTELLEAYRSRLLPLVDILTPNRQELARLAGETCTDDRERARRLLELGCGAVFVTGTDDPEADIPDDQVELALYLSEKHQHKERLSWRLPRLSGRYHGSGCTLAAALAARLANGDSLSVACESAQRFTWQSLVHAWQPSTGQALPR